MKLVLLTLALVAGCAAALHPHPHDVRELGLFVYDHCTEHLGEDWTMEQCKGLVKRGTACAERFCQ